ncbi:hypothetical protein Lfu02_39660 [Longispora fulva]|uniref:Uncharacterized protein n=1 Tax=Longispora fulva TaxID=619741 RepID=A0A8J7GSU1_9ACTN|nr:hypothetical protein [Longispora fulva]MBG6136426.1 hypothetical protein [Longispora fulva]GIG59594.1 hypothetical protein Lfu02_39660 [Longispora fulva]
MMLFTRDAPTGQPRRSDEPLGPGPHGTDPNQPPHPAATSRGTRRIGRLLVASGLGLLPWMYVLAAGLSAVATAPRWPAAWIGMDILEAAGLIATGLLAARGDRRHALAAAATAALLVVDAWFDTMTATSNSDLGAAIAMALCAELPLAAVCGWLAMRGSRQRN